MRLLLKEFVAEVVFRTMKHFKYLGMIDGLMKYRERENTNASNFNADIFEVIKQELELGKVQYYHQDDISLLEHAVNEAAALIIYSEHVFCIN
jgi:hypothetical protein